MDLTLQARQRHHGEQDSQHGSVHLFNGEKGRRVHTARIAGVTASAMGFLYPAVLY